MIIAVAKVEFLQMFSAKLDVALSEMAWQLIRLVWNKFMYLKFLPIGGYTTWKRIYRFTKDVLLSKLKMKKVQSCNLAMTTSLEYVKLVLILRALSKFLLRWSEHNSLHFLHHNIFLNPRGLLMIASSMPTKLIWNVIVLPGLLVAPVE